MIYKAFESVITYIQKNQYLFSAGLLLLATGIVASHQYESYQRKTNQLTSDKFFEIISQAKFLEQEEQLNQFTQSQKSSIYSDLIRLQQAKYFFDLRDTEKCIKALLETHKYSQSQSIRSLAAYRLANVLKSSNPSKALVYAERIKTKSMRGLKSILKAEIFTAIGEKAKAKIELDSLLSSTSNNNAGTFESVLLMELAHRHKLDINDHD